MKTILFAIGVTGILAAAGCARSADPYPEKDAYSDTCEYEDVYPVEECVVEEVEACDSTAAW